MTTRPAFSRAVMLAGTVLAGVATTSVATAQPADPAVPPSAGGKHAQIEEVVVVAQKRRENLQNVPISVTAITAVKLKAAAVTSTLSLSQVTPGLTVTQTGNSAVLFLRGVGTALSTPGDEGSVNVVVDGVVYTSLPSQVFSFNNISQIETLRGPQGTLFGRNAAGGVISITTRTPAFKPSADMSVGYGNYNTLSSSLYATGGLTRDIAADLAVQYDNQSDGYGRNLYSGATVGKTRDFSARSKLLWNVDADTSVKLSVDYETAGGDLGIPRTILPGAVGIGGVTTAPGGFWNIDANFAPRLTLRQQGVSLTVHHNFSWAQLTSITAYRDTHSQYFYDQDGSQLPLVNAAFNEREAQFTEELQLASLPQSYVKWIGGLFYLDSTAQENPLTLSGLPFAPLGGFTSRFGEIDTNSYAGFGQATVPLTPSTNVTAGIRFTSDQKTFRYHDTFAGGILTPELNKEGAFNQPTFRVSLDQKLARDLLAYAAISSGFKAGSFNIINPANPPILPETLTSYEAGLKSQLFDRRLRLNLAGFYYDYKNIQTSQIISGQTLFLNAKSGTVYGLDADFETASFAGFSLSGGAELLHTAYGDFPNAPLSAPERGFTCPATPQELSGPLTGGNCLYTFNARGKQFVHAPNFDLSLTASYLVTTSLGDFNASLTYAHTVSYPWEVDNRLHEPATDLLNAQLGWTAPSGRYDVRVWGRNLTNDQYYSSESSSLNDTGAQAPPRTYGVTLTAHI